MRSASNRLLIAFGDISDEQTVWLLNPLVVRTGTVTEYSLSNLPKWRLKELQALVTAELRRRFDHHQPPKYGGLNKGFTEPELERFLSHVDNPTAKAVFELMAGLGLRVSEACSLQWRDVDLNERRLWVRSLKNSRPTMFYLHDHVYLALLNKSKESEYVFPARRSCRYNHISPNWIRNEFRRAVRAAGLDFCYAESTEHCRAVRHLHRLTTHSLRHYFCRKCAIALHGDFRLLQQLSRHRDPKNVQRYCWVSQEEVDQAISSVFSTK